MADTIIENPILNSPYPEPDRHWRFTDEGITNEIIESRRRGTGRKQLPGFPEVWYQAVCP